MAMAPSRLFSTTERMRAVMRFVLESPSIWVMARGMSSSRRTPARMASSMSWFM